MDRTELDDLHDLARLAVPADALLAKHLEPVSALFVQAQVRLAEAYQAVFLEALEEFADEETAIKVLLAIYVGPAAARGFPGSYAESMAQLNGLAGVDSAWKDYLVNHGHPHG